VSEQRVAKVRQLNEMAKARGQSMAQMAVAWTLRYPIVTSALIGASRVSQLEELVTALDKLEFSDEELNHIDEILAA
jgi:L-glyceraldehyde 3-phosphate reductase